MPTVPKSGWPYFDHYCGDGWSLAYRTFDAQYWGVPQRRRRIYLVLDLTGQRAGEILFKRPGLRGYFETGGAPWKGTAADAPGGAGAGDRPVCIPINTMLATRWNALGRGTGLGIGEDGDPQFTISAAHEHAVCVPIILDDQGGQQITVREDGVSPTLHAEMHGHPPCVVSAGFKGRQGAASGSVGFEIKKSPTIVAGMTAEVVCKCYDARGNGDGKTASTITGDHENRITDYTTVVCMAHGQANAEICENCSPCLNCNHEQPIVFIRYIVRRLTPTECCRLQGFPDGWGEINPMNPHSFNDVVFWHYVYKTYCEINRKKPIESILRNPNKLAKWHNKLHTDRAEYKMWGNGIALPNAMYVMQGISEELNNE